MRLKKLFAAMFLTMAGSASAEVTLESLNLPEIKLNPDKEAAIKDLEQFETSIDVIKSHCEDCDELIDQVEELEEDFEEANGLPMFNFLGGPAYTPEQGLIIAAGGLYSLRMDRTQEDLQRSVISGFLITNYGNGFGYGLRSTYKLFFDHNDIQMEGKAFIGNMPSNYWGVGFDAGEHTNRGDTTEIDAFVADLDASFSRRIKGDWFADAIVRLNYFNPSDAPGTADENFMQYKDDPLSVGFGAGVRYDSRDVAINAWEGMFFAANILHYNDAWGSASDFSSINFDWRGYQSWSEGRVFALLVNYKQAFGDVPYYEMPTIGGGTSMRGVYRGQYRDKVASEVTLEYRHTFRGADGGLTNHGLTLWTGAGTVGELPSDLTGQGIVSHGIGYRYQLQPRANLRVDIGFSKTGSSFYFNFAEAF